MIVVSSSLRQVLQHRRREKMIFSWQRTDPPLIKLLWPCVVLFHFCYSSVWGYSSSHRLRLCESACSILVWVIARPRILVATIATRKKKTRLLVVTSWKRCRTRVPRHHPLNFILCRSPKWRRSSLNSWYQRKSSLSVWDALQSFAVRHRPRRIERVWKSGESEVSHQLPHKRDHFALRLRNA